MIALFIDSVAVEFGLGQAAIKNIARAVVQPGLCDETTIRT
jgi:hypothetical protein